MKKKRTGTQATKYLVRTYDIFFSIKCLPRKFYVVVVQNNGKEIYKKVSAARAKLFFLLLIRLNFSAVLITVAV